MHATHTLQQKQGGEATLEKACHRSKAAPQQTHQAKSGGSPSSAVVAVIGHQPTSVLDLLEDDSSHGLTRAISDAEEATERDCFVAMSLPNDNGGGNKEAPNQEEEHQRQRQALKNTDELGSEKTNLISFLGSHAAGCVKHRG